MDPKTRIKLRKLLAELYDDSRKIRKVLTDAGLYTGRLDLSGGAETIWHEALIEAEHVEKVNHLIETIGDDRPEKRAALNEILGLSSSTPSPVAASPTQVAEPQTVMPPQTAVTTVPPATPPPTRLIPIDLPRTLRLTAIDQQLLSALFAQATKVAVITEFTDGRTATRVLLARPTAADGGNLLPAVIKLGPRALIEPEWQATQRQVLDRLSGFVAVRGEPIYVVDEAGQSWGALRYAQVGDGVFDVESLSRYASHASIQDLWQVLANRLLRQLSTLWQNTQQWAPISFQQRYDGILPVNLEVVSEPGAKGLPTLLDATYLATTTDELPAVLPNTLVRLDGFVVTECSADGRELTLDLPQTAANGAAYRLRVQLPADAPPATVGAPYPTSLGRVRANRQTLLQSYVQPHLGAQIDLSQATAPLPDGTTLPNPLLALPTLLTRRQEGWLATIHGDLNLRNILIDPEVRTAHIIDCAAARQDHVLHDLLRLERDLLTDLAAQIFFSANLLPTAIVDFYRALHCACRGNSHEPGYFALPTTLESALEKLFVTLVTLRQAARERLAQPGVWAEYYTGLIIHLVGALKYRDLDQPAPGRQPKAIAFWAAATLVGLLQELASDDGRFCHALTWRSLDLRSTSNAASIAKDVLASPSSISRGTQGESPLEAWPTKGLTPPVVDDTPPVQRRLDVAVPAQATVQQPFLLAVAVRQNNSARLELTELPVQHSGNAQLEWPESEPYVRLRVQVVAHDCTIVGTDSYTFKLYRNLDSEVYYFSLIPQRTGRLAIMVQLYQDTDSLTSTPAYTMVSEQVVGEVPVQLHSSEPVAVPAASPRVHSPTRMPTQPLIKILFLAANPLDTVRLCIDEEVRAIKQALRQAEYRIFSIELGPAVQIEDLQDLLLQHQPDILHFSGHGATTSALIFQNSQGNSVQVPGAVLGQLFQVLKDNLRCIVLNACYSAELTAGLAKTIDCVVGIENEISDSAALQFATAFYRALGYGRSVQEAFALGKVQIELAGLGEADALHLTSTSAADLRFVDIDSQPTATTPTTPPTTDAAPSNPLPAQPPSTGIGVKRQATILPGTPPATPTLTPQAKMKLAQALLACPTMADLQTRDAIVSNLPNTIKGNIKRNPAALVDVMNIVTTAANYANGLEELIMWVRVYEGDSLTMQAVDQLLDA